MIKYVDTAVVFSEIPDEITLALEISNCSHSCENCHSPHLRENIGIEITAVVLDKLILQHPDCSCICFMGGDSDHDEVCKWAKWVKEHYPEIRVGMYSGDTMIDDKLMAVLDYYKVGPYIEDFGPLNRKTTNQKMYRISEGEVEDITHKFWDR